MIDIRNLTKEEFEQLMEEAPEVETRFLKQNPCHPYLFFKQGIVSNGLIIDGRPIYTAMVKHNENGEYVLWTIVNSNVKNKIALCKYVKRELKNWVSLLKNIKATMHKGCPENMKWVEWLGFKKIEEDEEYITYKLGE